LVLTISTKGVLDEEVAVVLEPELPRPPAVVPDVAEVLDPLAELLLVSGTLEVVAAETESPWDSPAVETIVPLTGA
jgi:hypothetical protein